jgi:hypothetical protein
MDISAGLKREIDEESEVIAWIRKDGKRHDKGTKQ